MNRLGVNDKLKDNKVPEGWVRVKLGELCKIIPGQAPLSRFYNKERKGYPFIKVNNFTNKYPIIDTWTTFSLKESKDTDILLSVAGSVGFVNYGINASITRSVFAIRPNQKSIQIFLFYLLKKHSNYFENLGSGSAQKIITIKSVEELKILFPSSLPEQQKIAEILETIDETIEKTDAIIEKCTRIKQGLMQDLLTRGIDDNGQIRSEETHKFKDSPLGRIPEKWEIVKVKDIGKIEGGYAFKSDSFLLNGKYQVIKIGNLYKGILDLKKNLAYLNTLNEQEKKYTLKHLEILITLTGTIGKKDYGYTVILKHPKKVIFNQRVARIRVINTQNNPIFIFYQTKIEFFLNQFFDNSKGGTGNQTNVSVYDLKKIKILRPPLPEQHRIALILSQIDETIEKEQKYKRKLKQIKQGLMEDLLTGKVRVLNVN
jgi:type I restriction enzyme S subunit